MAVREFTEIDEKLFLTVFRSPRHLKRWVSHFLDIDLPDSHVDPDSNSSPVEAMYAAYAAYRDDTCLQQSGFIWLSSRDSGKTLCGSILNIILMIHFKAQICHLAAVRKQSEKCLQYCNTCIRTLKPLLEKIGRQVITESKSKIQVLNEDGSISYIDVVVANLAGGNSEHVPIASFDELECLSPQGLVGYKEAKLIPTRFKGKGPLTIKYSTRKFAFGIFEQEIQNIKSTGEQLFRWNLIDITERCTPDRHRPDERHAVRYIAKELPLSTITKKEFDALADKDKVKYDAIKAFAGCAECKLLPVCKMRLATRSDDDHGGLFKNIDFTIRQFRELNADPDMAAAQLLCLKPSLSGLVYPRFDDKGNVYTLAEAYEKFTGSDKVPAGFTIEDLVALMKIAGVKFFAGVDWGSTHSFSISVSCVVMGEWWLMDNYTIPGLEFEEMLDVGKRVRDLYKPAMWYPDTSEPRSIKLWKKNRMPCKKFDKDVWGGIEATRGQIVNAAGRRRLKVIRHDRNEFMIDGFHKHHFKLDAAGLPTREPDDSMGTADVMDGIRYQAQNIFGTGGGLVAPSMNMGQPGQPQQPTDSNIVYHDWMAQKIHNLATQGGGETLIKSKSGTFIADFGGSDDEET